VPGRFPLTQLASEQTRLANRTHKILEDANIKLGAVASDILGKSGRAMLWALIGGQRDPDKLADLAEGLLHAKIPELKLALEGHFTEGKKVSGKKGVTGKKGVRNEWHSVKV